METGKSEKVQQQLLLCWLQMDTQLHFLFCNTLPMHPTLILHNINSNNNNWLQQLLPLDCLDFLHPGMNQLRDTWNQRHLLSFLFNASPSVQSIFALLIYVLLNNMESERQTWVNVCKDCQATKDKPNKDKRTERERETAQFEIFAKKRTYPPAGSCLTSELDVASKEDKKERQDDMEILKRNGSKKHEKEMRQEDEEDAQRKSKEETKRYQRMEWNEEREEMFWLACLSMPFLVMILLFSFYTLPLFSSPSSSLSLCPMTPNMQSH